jgi:hypothetical protein
MDSADDFRVDAAAMDSADDFRADAAYGAGRCGLTDCAIPMDSARESGPEAGTDATLEAGGDASDGSISDAGDDG